LDAAERTKQLENLWFKQPEASKKEKIVHEKPVIVENFA